MSREPKPCLFCGKRIIWDYMPRNKQPMPFDEKLSPVLTEDGQVKWGHALHFITCKRGKSVPEAKEA